MYQKSDLKNLYDRLKRQYPRYGLDFSGDRLTMTRLHSKVEVDREGVKLYVNGELYDQFTSGDVDDPDDLYELIEAFLLDLQHDGMRRGNATYLAAAKQATRMGRRVLILTAVSVLPAANLYQWEERDAPQRWNMFPSARTAGRSWSRLRSWNPSRGNTAPRNSRWSRPVTCLLRGVSGPV